MAMKCEEIELLLVDYIDNTLEAPVSEEVSAHLQHCERCRDVHTSFVRLHEEIDATEMEAPDNSLRENFYHMLQAEINKQVVAETPPAKAIRIRFTPVVMRIAAAVALLVTGVLTGYWISSMVQQQRQQGQMAEMKDELQSMKQLMMLSMLKEESPSQRLQAVSYAEEMPVADRNVLDALINTLNHDANVNVRMAAAYSLARFAGNADVRDSLVQSLTRQTEPILQVVLMNILVEHKVTQAVKPMNEIIQSDNTMKEVKSVAEKGLQQLM